MKKLFVLSMILAILSLSVPASAIMTGIDGHNAYIYPVVRVTTERGGGSGTVIYSEPSDKPGEFKTYILTNHHVVASAISISEEWDSAQGKNIDVERKQVVNVEIFKYRDISTPTGQLRVEADIVIYNKTEDMALLKLRFIEQIKHVAKTPERKDAEKFLVLDKTIAVGCSLLYPPLPTVGEVTRINMNIRSLPYHMSSSSIIYGNSGGAMFLEDGTLIGIPSMVAAAGWGIPITHMGLFIPISRVYDWFNDANYEFLFEKK